MNKIDQQPNGKTIEVLQEETAMDPWHKFTRLLSDTARKAIIVAFIGILLLPLQNFSPSPDQFKQNFWFHDTLLKWFSEFRFSTLNDRYFDKVFVGNNNWLMYIDTESVQDIQRTNQFTPEELQKIQSKLNRANAYFEKMNIIFALVITPDKNTIYPEYIPPQIQVLKNQSRLDQLVEYEKAQGGFQIIDLRPSLFQARQQDEVYYPDDTHWNPLGAQIAYTDIMQALQKKDPKLQAHSLDEYQRVPTGKINGDLANLAGIIVPTQKFELSLKIGKTYTLQNYQTPQIPKIALTGNMDPAAPVAVIFQDSFFDELIPFFADHFSRGVYVMSQGIDLTLINRERPNIIILEYTERYMQRLLDIPDL